VRAQIANRRIVACHDLSDGGLLVALAEMCLAGGTGVEVALPAGNAVPSHAFLYGEDQARYLVACNSGEEMVQAAQAAGVPATVLGYSGGATLAVRGVLSLSLGELRSAHEAWLPAYMNATE
ncbi:MAG: AIR synthase-related protein, partial [Reyranella sp.]